MGTIFRYIRMLFVFLALFSLAAGQSSKPGCIVDLVYVVDGSTSITNVDWVEDLEFLANATMALNISSSGSHIGIVQFASQGSTTVESQLVGNEATLVAFIKTMKQLHGNTAMGNGLLAAQEKVFATSGRADVPKVIVLVTDGVPNEGYDPVSVATKLKAAPYNITIICVG